MASRSRQATYQVSGCTTFRGTPLFLGIFFLPFCACLALCEPRVLSF
ncbi:hypothetical protein EC2762100_5234 [Escherichia coli 2762100]|nr:hypothetical protein EC2762100_5234 [Escherichia coli 2762100]